MIGNCSGRLILYGNLFFVPFQGNLFKNIELEKIASKIVSYAQGLDLITKVGADKGWNLNLGEIAKIWRGGCIIRARFLNHITEAYTAATPPTNLMLAPFFTKILNVGGSETHLFWYCLAVHLFAQSCV